MKTMVWKYIKYVLISCFLICSGVIASTRDCVAETYGTLNLDGYISVEWTATKITLFVTSLSFDIDEGYSEATSGTPKLSVWATKEKYSGGTLSGYRLYSKKLDQIESSTDFTGYQSYIYVSGKLLRKPKGTYYLTVTAEQYDTDGKYYIDDYVNLDGKYKRFRSGRGTHGKRVVIEGLNLSDLPEDSSSQDGVEDGSQDLQSIEMRPQK